MTPAFRRRLFALLVSLVAAVPVRAQTRVLASAEITARVAPAAPLLPGTPESFDADVTGNTVAFRWSPPDVGAPPSGYALVARATPGGPITAAVPVGDVTSYRTTAPDGVYVVTVVAFNANGPGPESNPLTLMLPGGFGRPDGPTNLRVTLQGSSVAFRWTAPTTGGPVDQYVVIVGDGPGFSTPTASLDVPPTQTVFAIPHVPPGTYYARVYARNRFGPSAYASNEVVVPVAGLVPPSSPVLAAPAVQGATARVSWSPGPGSAATSYVLVAAFTPGGAPVATARITGTAATFAGVVPGTYYLRLYGVNDNGVSPPSNEAVLLVP